MIYEHEIPSKSRLYFAKSAKQKREIERIASDVLYANEYEEIVTPFFSYHQHQSMDEKSLIRYSDAKNHILSMRADSTLDVVRIITKRLGRSVKQKKWFYIQPVFQYPSSEQYQIGAEFLENCDLSQSINISAEIIKKLDLRPLLQISNINIPRLISQEFDLPLSVFQNTNLEEIFALNETWLSRLASLQHVSQIDEVMDAVPETIKNELEKIKSLCASIDYDNIVIAPLFYTKMRYYDNLFFRYIENNIILGAGGEYSYDKIDSTGFALQTDNLIEELSKK